MDLSQYLDIFISEGQDHLQAMNQALLALEKHPDDLGHLETFFRAAHTLKGMSAALGFQQMSSLSHEMEDLLDALRQKKNRLTPESAQILFRCLDTLADLLQGIAAGEGEKGDTTSVRALLRSIQAAPAPTPTAPPAPIAEAGWEVQVDIAPDCALKGPRAFLVLKRLRTVAPILQSEPPEAALRTGQYQARFRVLCAAEADPEALRQAANSVAEVTAVAVSRLAAQDLPALKEPPAPPPPAAVPALPGPPAAQAPPPPAPAAEAPAPAAPIVRIKVDLLDQLLEAVAGLVINRSHLAQVAEKYAFPDLKEAIEAHAGAMDRLQEIVLAMRMTPVAQVFNRFPRMVRDLAREQGKELEFEMQGTELELDRTILDKITDPLVHLLRNAVDHGVETPPERRQAGKSPAASVRLRASRIQDKAIIEVRDDGRGMSPGKIAAAAIERGLITPTQAGEMDTPAILDLICRPGFSTASRVTGVSGRGVGMEVVKEVMNEIGGALEIESQPGQGSCFRMTFPLTMAILPALLVRVREETYAMPLAHVVRTIEPLRSQVQQLHQQPVLCWEDKVLPLAFMADLLAGSQLGQQGMPGEFLPVVIVERGHQRYGLVVDEILGKEDIVLKPLEGILQIEGLAGATLRGEGQVVLVLDVAALVRLLARGPKEHET